MKTLNDILTKYHKNSFWQDENGLIAVKAEYGYGWYAFKTTSGKYELSGNTNDIERPNCTFHRANS